MRTGGRLKKMRVVALAAALVAGASASAHEGGHHATVAPAAGTSTLAHTKHEPAPADVKARQAASTAVTLHERALVTQDGKSIRFPQEVIGDRIVVMDFVYTTCTTVCPTLSAIFGQLQGTLGDRLGKEVALVSVSVDPGRDTPARLKAYATSHGARPGWLWLTGDKTSVDVVLKGLGAYTPNFEDHPSMVLVGDGRSGKWTRLFGFPGPNQIMAAVDALAMARTQAATPAPRMAQPQKVSQVRRSGSEEPATRQYFTDLPLLTQDGKRVRFYSDVLKDRVVLINFIYTQCKDTCPISTQKLLQVKELLGERFGAPVFFVSISVDAENDTPEALRRFAERQNALDPAWVYLTGDKANIDHVVGKLGQYNEEVREHSTLMIAGNVKTRHWTKIMPMASPKAIALKLEDLALER